jgi:hypothetical protein
MKAFTIISKLIEAALLVVLAGELILGVSESLPNWM